MPDHAAVDIANFALGAVGAARITAIDEDSPEGRAVNQFYNEVLEDLLESYPWKFAITRRQLAKDATGPAFGRTNAFTLPAEALQLLPPYPEDDYRSRDWIIESGKVYTDDGDPLDVRYVEFVDDPNRMSPSFRKAFALMLAVELCEPLTKSNTKKESLISRAQAQVRKAMSIDARQVPPVETVDDTLLESRL